MPVPRRRTRLSSRVARKTEVFSGPDKRSSPGSAKTAEGRLRAIGIERGQPVGWCRHLSRRQIGNAQRTYKGLASNPRRRPRNLHRADCAFLSFVGGTVRKNAGQGNTPRLQRAPIMTSKPGGPEGNARVWDLAVPREAISAQSPDNLVFYPCWLRRCGAADQSILVVFWRRIAAKAARPWRSTAPTKSSLEGNDLRRLPRARATLSISASGNCP